MEKKKEKCLAIYSLHWLYLDYFKSCENLRKSAKTFHSDDSLLTNLSRMGFLRCVFRCIYKKGLQKFWLKKHLLHFSDRHSAISSRQMYRVERIKGTSRLVENRYINSVMFIKDMGLTMILFRHKI